MSVIELGEIGSQPEPADRFAGPRHWRRWAAGGVVLLCALTLGASRRPEPPMVRQLWEVALLGDHQATVRDDGIFIYQRTSRSLPEITAYEPATGAVRWRHALGAVPSYLPQGVEAGLLLVSADEKYAEYELEDGSPGTIAYGGTTTAVDTASGAERWSLPGEVQAVTTGTVLLGERSVNGELTSIRAVRSGDGSVVWQRPLGRATQVLVPQDGPDAERVIVSGPAGAVTVLDYADGAVLRRGTVPWTPQEPTTGAGTYLTPAGDLLIVVDQKPAGTRLTAYRADTLQRLWDATAAVNSYPQACGPVICLDEAVAAHGLDPGTGERLWTLPGFANAYQVADDRVLLTSGAPDDAAVALLDVATGERIGPGGTGWPLVTRVPGDAVYLIKRYYTRNQPTSSISRLDPATGRAARIGVLTGVDGPRCGTAQRYLACQTADRLSVITVG